MRIDGREIGEDQPPYVIAEISGNHGGEFQRAMDLVGVAADAGADAVKLQTYTADTLTIESDLPDFKIEDPDSLWSGRTLYDLYDEAHTPWDWHEALFAEARRLGLHAFSTPFDETAVDFLEGHKVPCYKIASFEHTFIPLVKKVAATRKPLIISCGLASMEEIEETHDAFAASNSGDLCLLSCTSSYPANITDSNLRRIPALKTRFPECQVGLSDHTIGSTAAVAAVALGATVFEKHIKLSDDDNPVDGAFSAAPAQMEDYVQQIKDAWGALGDVNFGAASAAEQKSERFRRSIYVVEDMAEGEAFTPANIRCIRPGYGLATKHWEEVLGRTARRPLRRGTPLEQSMIRPKGA